MIETILIICQIVSTAKLKNMREKIKWRRNE